ncbi:hypothetical protein OHC33_007731 [Knufia fluminis]|uniref:Mid2 domain-containing protein n=1 Tax=Knufia fluminis TaxID=191047 RepID=A0AAN8ESM4_9EURO|nr:hypothetical protein OHC33_007731 [Knufia fluminis]
MCLSYSPTSTSDAILTTTTTHSVVQSTHYSTSVPTNDAPQSKPLDLTKGARIGAAVGGGLGGVLLIALIIVGIIQWRKSRRTRRASVAPDIMEETDSAGVSNAAKDDSVKTRDFHVLSEELNSPSKL